MSLVVWWVAPPSEWVARMTRRPCAKSCGDSSGPSTVVLAAAHDRLPELAYFVTTAGPMCIAFVFWLFYFLLAPLPLKRLPKRLRLNHQTPCFSCEILVCLVCINWTKFLVRVSRTRFLDGELGLSVMGFIRVSNWMCICLVVTRQRLTYMTPRCCFFLQRKMAHSVPNCLVDFEYLWCQLGKCDWHLFCIVISCSIWHYTPWVKKTRH